MIGIGLSITIGYNTHKNTIVKQQKKQIILIAETASRSLERFFEEEKKGMDLYFDGMLSNISDVDTLRNQIDDIISVYYESEKTYLNSINFYLPGEIEEKNRKEETVFDTYEYQREGYYILNLVKPLFANNELGGYIVTSINLNKVYDEILAPIQVGELGYCTIKDRKGIILMHGTKNQIGIDSKSDRMEKHPDLNSEGIDKLLESQLRGESGSEIIVSYWWDNIEAGKVKKILGFTPVQIVEDFWVLSVIMDYSQVAKPLQNALRITILIGIILVIFFGSLVFYITRELKNTQRIRMEWKYQAELNEASNKFKKQEEQVQQYDKLQTIGILTGMIAHELNNLMTPIMIYCDLLSMKFAKNDDVMEEVSGITAAAKRCAELSHQLLAYGREDKEKDQKEIFDSSLVVKNSMKMIAKLFPREIKLTFDISNKPIFLSGNPGEINQILLNLCTNAYKAMKGTYGKLEVTYQKISEYEVELNVSDTGCGMDQETMEQMYNAFFTTKLGGEGTGLGLSVVKQLVVKYGGRIQANSLENKGTIFTIILPILDKLPVTHERSVTNRIEIEKKKFRIMVLDDQIEILKPIKKGLSMTKWKVEYYTNPGFAYGVLKEKKDEFDILITDISMPSMSGLELAAIIRKSNPEIKIIAMTGYLNKDIQEYVDNNIIDGFLLKPITTNDIIDMVAKIISKSDIKLRI
jgi:signal transduction histidine kinase/ActR/RegA family two-component response regulator